MKAIILLIFIGLTLVISTFLVSFSPYHFYNSAVTKGMSSKFFTIEQTQNYLHSGKYYSLNKMDGLSSESKELWEVFHFQNFELPLPIKHPVIEFIPIVERRKNRPILGAKLKLRNKSVIAEFKILESYKFDRKTRHHKLFELPFFKNYLLSVDDKTLWKDMFTKSLKLPQGSFLDVEYWKALWKISYKELAYNLYLLQFRKEFLPSNARALSYYSNKSFGIVELIDVEKASIGLEGIFRDEMVYVFDKGFIHKVKISTKYEDMISEAIRIKFISSLVYRPSEESSSIEIYARYKNLAYHRRITQEGFTFLFAAWSHVTEKKEYIKEMIQFLERGKMSYEVLAPLYDYSYKEFGSNFSIMRDNLRENEAEKLKRKIKEEAAAEKLKLEQEDLNTVKEEGDFENEDEKVKYFLEKAKDSEALEDSNILYKD
ncbi:hypothetical protein [Halobacteriovorax sp. HLS]|uniref:hypothetical protein n=1 Tax=Halobacteriovorax sp. HLS TaxID=2234000 RepID=UPI000FD9AEEA|nr:hypothetical protein [Halobacteriovorax sp. HLS]